MRDMQLQYHCRKNFFILNFRFTKIPTAELVNIKTLKKLDLRFNKLIQFDPEFIEQIKLGLDVEYEGTYIYYFNNFIWKAKQKSDRGKLHRLPNFQIWQTKL